MPPFQVMYNRDSASVPTFDGEATWTVSDDGSEMLVTGVDVVHFGFYYCVSQNASITDHHVLVTKRAINYKVGRH